MIIVELFQMTEFDVEQLIHQHRSISVSKSCNLSSKLEKGTLANSQFLKCKVFRQHNPSTNIKKLLTLTEMKSCKSYKMETNLQKLFSNLAGISCQIEKCHVIPFSRSCVNKRNYYAGVL